MSTVTLARRQVWLAQSPLSEGCRRTLCSLPVVPGQMFGPPAQQALEQSSQADHARQRFAGLRRGPGLVPRQRDLLSSGTSYSHPPVHPGGVGPLAILSTMISTGYTLQFRCWPPSFHGVRMSAVREPLRERFTNSRCYHLASLLPLAYLPGV